MHGRPHLKQRNYPHGNKCMADNISNSEIIPVVDIETLVDPVQRRTNQTC